MSNEGIMTNVWGPPGWVFLHCITVGYPYKINSKNKEHMIRKKNAKIFFNSLAYVLPCTYCRESFLQYITEHPIDKHLNTRKKLSKWFYDLHNKINKKLGVPNCDIPSFKEFYQKYETYRAKCKKTTKKDRIKRKEKGCINPKDGIPKRTHIKIFDIFGEDCSLLKKDQKIEKKDLEIIQKFVKNNNVKTLSKLSKKTTKYVLQNALKCINNKLGNISLSLQIINFLR
jgi:hypothetical protein